MLITHTSSLLNKSLDAVASLDLRDLVVTGNTPHHHDLLESILAVLLGMVERLLGCRRGGGLHCLLQVLLRVAIWVEVQQVILKFGVGTELWRSIGRNLCGLRWVYYNSVSCWSSCWLCEVLYALNQYILSVTAFHTWWYLLHRLDVSLNQNWLLSLCGYPCRDIVPSSISGRDIVFHELLLKLRLLLPLPGYLLLAQVFIAVVSISVKIYWRPLPWKHIALLRGSHDNLLSRVLYYDFWHMLGESGRLLVRVGGRIPAGCRVIHSWVWAWIIESLSRV